MKEKMWENFGIEIVPSKGDWKIDIFRNVYNRIRVSALTYLVLGLVKDMVWIIGNKISFLANNFLCAVEEFSVRCENNFEEKKLGF